MRPRNKSDVKYRLCGGCRNDRYNYPGTCERPGVDAPVTSQFCWSNDPARALYCRGAREWVMPCHTGTRQRWLREWAETGRRPKWRCMVMKD